MAFERKIKILLAKVGLDGHDRGIRVLSVMLRDAGMEVIYPGLHQTPETLVWAAIEEDVDVIGISYLSGGELSQTPKIVQLMKDNTMDDVLLLVGGVFPKEEIPILKEMGVDEVFMGSSTQLIIDYIKRSAKQG
jgi:methylmalonyl-CoA mutase C-terminal domain/subunit